MKSPLPALLLFLAALFPARADTFVKGADVGWLPQMEAAGYKFQDAAGTPKDCLQILKENGINTIRLRVFVNPSSNKKSGHCSEGEVADMAVRAQSMGFRIMIDFHYSDSWADPGKQYKPAAWAGHSFDQLLNDVSDHTTHVLTTLKARGVTPEWVQVGNEITQGMLWPDGRTPNWEHLAQLIDRGYDAVKAVDPTSKVVIHLDRGANGPWYRTYFDNLQKNGGKWDVIGMSYYPHLPGQNYTTSIDALGANLNDMASRYGKEVMIAEVGLESAKPDETYDMLLAVQAKLRAVPNGKGLGLIYWEPEGDMAWSHYPMSCWADGKPTKALTAFLDTPRAGAANK